MKSLQMLNIGMMFLSLTFMFIHLYNMFLHNESVLVGGLFFIGFTILFTLYATKLNEWGRY